MNERESRGASQMREKAEVLRTPWILVRIFEPAAASAKRCVCIAPILEVSAPAHALWSSGSGKIFAAAYVELYVMTTRDESMCSVDGNREQGTEHVSCELRARRDILYVRTGTGTYTFTAIIALWSTSFEHYQLKTLVSHYNTLFV